MDIVLGLLTEPDPGALCCILEVDSECFGLSLRLPLMKIEDDEEDFGF
jgi:hypothetical protein